MSIKIIAFGKLVDVLPQSNWEMESAATVGELQAALETQFPALKDLRYRIAVDKTIATQPEHPIQAQSVVALMPPFSGG